MTTFAFVRSLPVLPRHFSRRIISHRVPSIAVPPLRPPSVVIVRAAASTSAQPRSLPQLEPPLPASDLVFQCPVCATPYGPVPALQLDALPSNCSNCSAPVVQKDGYVDMTAELTTPLSPLFAFFTRPRQSSLFQLPPVSYAYERGWRNAFVNAGFPGIDREFEMFLDFVGRCGIVLDLSCGSGLMARRLAVSNEIGRVIASDYSDAMLGETVQLARRDVMVPEFDVVRADVASLPFVDGVFDAIHSGAALHCWPNVQDGLAEVKRVLKPGGKFFATTMFRLAFLPRRERLAKSPRIMKALMRVEDSFPGDRPYRFFEKDELEYLFKAAGFVNLEVEERKACAIIRCQKPHTQS